MAPYKVCRKRELTRLAVVAHLAVLPALSLPCPSPAADQFQDEVRRDTEWLASYPSRVVGSDSHDRAADELLAKIRAIPGVRVWTDEFSTVMPVTEEAWLSVEEGALKGKHQIHPVWPALVRLNTTPESGIAGRLVYVGRADCAELPVRTLHGNIAVMEMSGGPNWRAAYDAGATAIVLLGSDRMTQGDFLSHLVPVPVDAPRFYVPSGKLADALRGSGISEGRLFCRASWLEKKARNVYALVQSPNAKPMRALAICGGIDSMGVVPDLAPGADAAVDAAFLLNLLRRFAGDPPARPILFAFLDAQAIDQLGVRRMLSAFAVTPGERRNYLEEDQVLMREYLQHEKLAERLEKDASLPQVLDSLCRNEFRPIHRYIRDEVAREVTLIDYDLGLLRIRLYRVSGAEKQAVEAEVSKLAEQRTTLNGVQANLLTSEPMKPHLLDLGTQIWKRARARITEQRKELAQALARHRSEDDLRKELLGALNLEGKNERPLHFLLGLDLSDSGTAAGPSLWCEFLDCNEAANAADFRRWLNQVLREEPGSMWPGELSRAADLGPFRGMDSPSSFSLGQIANPTSPAQSFGLPAMTWATLDGRRDRVDTPDDCAERLDWKRLDPQIAVTAALIGRIARKTDFDPSFTSFPGWWRGARGVIVEHSLGEPVPRLPMQGYLTTLVPGSSAVGTGRAYVAYRKPVPGMRVSEYCFTGVDGRFRFEAMPARVGSGGAGWAYKNFFVQSYLIRADGAITRAVDLNKVGKGVRLNVDVGGDVKPTRAVVFTCDELTACDLIDPSFLQRPAPGNSSIIDAVRCGKPKRVNYCMSDGLLSCMLEPGTRWMHILRLGATQNRMALLNMTPDSLERGLTLRQSMVGFDLGQRLPSIPAHVAAQDYYSLNERRLADYAGAGIRSTAIEKLREGSKRLLQDARDATGADDGAKLYNSAMGAMANEVRAYQAVRDLANDVVRAAIFLLLALAPFSFAFERLVFGSSSVYRQILLTLLVFAVMTAMLWSFHPAFRISSQPLIIIMAFAIILMSILVISVVYSKFETGLEQMRSGRAESSGARTSRSGVLASAVALGIANMRKRKMRTALTGTTIVLITFAILCFSSVSKYVDKRELRLDLRSPYSGVMIRQPTGGPIPAQILPYLRTFPALAKTTVPRYWCCSAGDGQWRIHVRNPATAASLSMKAAIGLAPGESALTGVDKALPNWDKFGSGGCYLSRQVAAELRLNPGDKVLIAGRSLELVGVFDGATIETQLRDMDGQSLLPHDYTVIDAEQRQTLVTTDFNVLSTQLENAQSLEPGVPLPRVDGDSLVVMAAEAMERNPLIENLSLRSVAAKLGSPEEAKELASVLAGRLALPVYYGSAEGVRVVTAAPLKPQIPKGLFIPLLVTGLIIFNTLMNSIAERKKEIHIYTSLGLAPVHVGVLFVAEAITYGLMGSILGYVAGQAVASLLSRLGLLGGITLNYSGTQAVMTMGIVLAVVTVSALVPARVAARVAAPSRNMSWTVPQPVGDTIVDILPFTVTKRAAKGMIRFLYDYMDAHREGSIGHFSTDELRVVEPADSAKEAARMEGTIWLSPYDLGVRQRLAISARQTTFEDICEIDVELRRESGQTRSWWRLNRVFLGDLRKQLLGWRKLSPDRLLEFIEAAERSKPGKATPGITAAGAIGS